MFAIFRNSRNNLASSFFHIFHLASLWVGNLLDRHASTASSVSQAIQLMQHDWDSSQVVQITSTETEAASDEPILIIDVPDLDPLAPDSANN